MAYIDNLIAAPLSHDLDNYLLAANYLLFIKTDVEKVIPLTDYYLQIKPEEYVYRMRIQAYAHMGKKQKAFEAVEQAIAAMKREYANRPDRLKVILQHFAEERDRVSAN